MTGSVVLLDIREGVAHVTLNRPEVHNAFDETVIAHLTGIIEDITLIEEIYAVVLRGAGKSFSAGGDLNWMKRAAGYTEQQNFDDAMKLAHLLNKLYTLPFPTVACVQGAAMGGGMGLVSCCDVVIADKDAVFSLSEVKLGLIPATIGPYVIRAIGERQFRRYAMTGERFAGPQAQKIGLVLEIAERPEDMEYILQTVLKNFAANGRQAMKAAKILSRDLAAQPLSDKLVKDTAKQIAQIRAGAEAKEGVGAFLEKRKAGWAK